jgi:hypothetical protein
VTIRISRILSTIALDIAVTFAIPGAAQSNANVFPCNNPKLQMPTDLSNKHSVTLSWKPSVSLSIPVADGEGYNLYRVNPDRSCTKINASLIQGTD